MIWGDVAMLCRTFIEQLYLIWGIHLSVDIISNNDLFYILEYRVFYLVAVDAKASCILRFAWSRTNHSYVTMGRIGGRTEVIGHLLSLNCSIFLCRCFIKTHV